MKLIAKKHNVGGTVLLAICDPDVLDKTLTGPKNARFMIRRTFYGEAEVDVEDLVHELTGAQSINAIGRKSVEFLLGRGYGNPKSVIMFGDVPHLIFMKI